VTNKYAFTGEVLRDLTSRFTKWTNTFDCASGTPVPAAWRSFTGWPSNVPASRRAASASAASSGRPSADAFERTVAGLVRRQATRTNGKLRVYGELVDLLACDDNLRASDELELLWLELLREWPVRLHCGYTGATFTNERTAPVMKRICERHDAVQRCDTDLLANWLLTQNT